MTSYSKVLVAGSTIIPDTCKVTKTLGEVTAVNKFTAVLNNYKGDKSTDFTIGDEVKIYVDKNTSPPTTQIFEGIVENIELTGKELSERLVLSGRDYSARLIDRTVEPEVYNNLPAGSIVKDIIAKYTDDITTTNVSDGIVIDRIVFNQLPVYDTIKQLADFAGYTFYVDNSKDLHFKAKSTSTSGYTFDNSNILSTTFKEKRDEIFNDIWVYGDRYLDGYTETFPADGTGSVFTLLYKPHNTVVTVGGTLIQPGGIYQMTYGLGSDVKYLVNYNDRQIIFTSGTEQGDNIPSSGTSPVVVDYMRDLPIVKHGDNDSSISQYGRRTKVVQDTAITDPTTAETVMLQELDEFSDPLKQGTLHIKDVANLNVGDTCIVNIPIYNINNVTYDILQVDYDMSQDKLLQDNILSLKVNKRNSDITDTLKDILLSQKKLQSQNISNTDLLTRYKLSPGSFGIRQSGLAVYTRSIAGDVLIYDSPTYGIYNTQKYGGVNYNFGFVLSNVSASILGTSVLGSGNLGQYNLLWSGGYF